MGLFRGKIKFNTDELLFLANRMNEVAKENRSYKDIQIKLNNSSGKVALTDTEKLLLTRWCSETPERNITKYGNLIEGIKKKLE